MRSIVVVAALAVAAAPAAADGLRPEPAVQVTVLDGGAATPPRVGLRFDVFGGPAWLAGATHADPSWTVQGGVGFAGDVCHDWLGFGDVLALGVRAHYGTVDVDAESAVRHDFVIIAGNEPYLLSGTNRFTGTERLAMATLLGECIYTPPGSGPVRPWVALGAGVMEIFGDHGKTHFALRAAIGCEWLLGPVTAVTLEASDLAFRAPVLSRHHAVHALGLHIGLRWRF